MQQGNLPALGNYPEIPLGMPEMHWGGLAILALATRGGMPA